MESAQRAETPLVTLDHEAPSQAHLRMGIAFLRQCEQAKMGVFVHCMAGVGRSSSRFASPA